jgi:Leucine-rich repeat (LRR) protein
MGLNAKFLLGFFSLLFASVAVAKTVMLEGKETAIPPITQEIRALHLRAVGATRVYALQLPSALEDLNLSANDLMLLPNNFVPVTIKRVWLADNQLRTLPKSLAQWERLTYLNVDRNLLETLPDLSKTSLRWLRVNGNQLVTLPALPDSVERLYLADNKLTEFTKKPKALRHLTLANNPIENIPDDLGCGLEELDLSGTKVKQLPANLEGWRTLRVLNLAHCPLSEVEKDRLEAFFDPLKTLLIF